MSTHFTSYFFIIRVYGAIFTTFITLSHTFFELPTILFNYILISQEYVLEFQM